MPISITKIAQIAIMSRKQLNHTWDTEGWHEAACAAASWSLGPDPANSNEMELSLPKDLAAFTALTDWILREPPSCSAKTKVLIFNHKTVVYKWREYLNSEISSQKWNAIYENMCWNLDHSVLIRVNLRIDDWRLKRNFAVWRKEQSFSSKLWALLHLPLLSLCYWE